MAITTPRSLSEVRNLTSCVLRLKDSNWSMCHELMLTQLSPSHCQRGDSFQLPFTYLQIVDTHSHALFIHRDRLKEYL
ncbi:hypothetical protein AX14_002517 [Amanita brunnescens Koide BX004]|nr:hypothetical protein AX14_002517 [Amanita brunnescens Koide BX004]